MDISEAGYLSIGDVCVTLQSKKQQRDQEAKLDQIFKEQEALAKKVYR